MSKKSWWEKKYTNGVTKVKPVKALATLYETHTDAEIAQYLSTLTGLTVTKNAVTKKRQDLGLAKTTRGQAVAASPFTRHNEPVTLSADNALVLADIHAPYHDAEWLNRLLTMARRLNIQQCVLAGDLLDFATLSHFTPAMLEASDIDADLSDELEAAQQICRAIGDTFEHVLWTVGNHEKRLARRLGCRQRVGILKSLLGPDAAGFTISKYGYCIIESHGQRWRPSHPKNYSVIPARVAARLSDKYHMHVIAAHGHDWGQVVSLSGDYLGLACGMCADPYRLEYAVLDDTTSPMMQQGAFMLYRGRPYLLHPTWAQPEHIT